MSRIDQQGSTTHLLAGGGGSRGGVGGHHLLAKVAALTGAGLIEADGLGVRATAAGIQRLNAVIAAIAA